MRPAVVLHVPASATTLDACPRVTVASITDVQRLVGGYVEQFPVPSAEGMLAYGDEDALVKGAPTNHLATLALGHFAGKAGETPPVRVVGDRVFGAYDPDEGWQDVPESFVSELAGFLPRSFGA
jgi:hypothetical protein